MNKYLPGVKVVTRFDLGWTEDEWNNFVIEAVQFMNKPKEAPPAGEKSAICGKPVTITLRPENFT